MAPILTTICPYWNRPDALHIYLKALAGASIPEVKHIILFVGGGSKSVELPSHQFEFVDLQEIRGASIGHYHNAGAEYANTEWIMKSDVDVIPHVWFFKHLLPIIQIAKSREWFNPGFIYVRQRTTEAMLGEENIPLQPDLFSHIVRKRDIYSQHRYTDPAGSQFVCRRQEYLELGGCDSRFMGWGWEDYQQLYMLEGFLRGGDPLPGEVTFDNVCRRCRDEISRAKALQLFQRDPLLCLLHRWHPGVSKDEQDRNKQVLFNYVIEKRAKILARAIHEHLGS